MGLCFPLVFHQRFGHEDSLRELFWVQQPEPFLQNKTSPTSARIHRFSDCATKCYPIGILLYSEKKPLEILLFRILFFFFLLFFFQIVKIHLCVLMLIKLCISKLYIFNAYTIHFFCSYFSIYLFGKISIRIYSALMDLKGRAILLIFIE